MKTLTDEQLKGLLLKGGYITEDDFKKAEKYAKEKRSSIVSYLFFKNILNKDLLGQAVSEFYNVSYADLNSNKPSREQALKIAEPIAKKFRIVLFKSATEGITITTDDPKQAGLAEQLKKLFPAKKITVAYSLSEDIDDVFVYYHKALETRFNEIIKAKKRVAPEIIDEIIADALTFRASDIHFEPRAKEIVIRFRIDGVLREAGRIPKEYYENLVNRIKVKSLLRIDEHLSTQDGSMSHEWKGKKVDLRTSIVPILEGEKIVLRVLATYVQGLNLGDLGLSAQNQKFLEESSKKPFGMILTTGPTGSGKTTTLYTLLKLLNRPESNLTTIEDPVEYKIVGVNQIQVNEQTGLTFAKGLRSIVRQDPDIILVGEIRDTETAEIAVNAALTGHLMLSTFHANDAATAMPRILDMGVEPFLLASTLELIVAQRLIRRLCDECRYSVSVSQEELFKVFKEAPKYFPNEKTTFYKGKGCKNCGDSGYRGRTGIFEFIRATKEIRDLILKNPSTDQIWELARKQKALSLFEDGIFKVKEGITTLEELLRVAQPPLN
ncbi:MAG: GspE/PulE family protein [Candidatus Paceibacterota bacterium]